MPKRAERSVETGRYSLAHLTLIGCSAPELVYVAARAGYDAVSPRFIPQNVPGEFACYPQDRPSTGPVQPARADTQSASRPLG